MIIWKLENNAISPEIIFKVTTKENMSLVPDFRHENFEGLKAHLSTEVWEGLRKVNHQVSGYGNGLAQEEVITVDNNQQTGNISNINEEGRVLVIEYSVGG